MPLVDELLTIFRGAGVGDVRTPRGSRRTWYGPVDVTPPPFPAPTPDELKRLKDMLTSCEPTTELCKALNNLGLIGCATTRRISALAATLRISRKDLLPCIQGLAKRCKPDDDPCRAIPPLPLDQPRAPRDRILPSTGLICPAPPQFRPKPPPEPDCRYASAELKRLSDGLFNAVVNKRALNPADVARELTRAAAIACSPTLSRCPSMADDLLTLKRRLNLYLQRFPSERGLGRYLDTINAGLDALKGGRPPISPRQEQQKHERLRDGRNAGRRIRFAAGKRR